MTRQQSYSPIPRPKNGFLDFDNVYIHISRIYGIPRNIFRAIRTRSQTQNLNLKTLSFSSPCVFCNDVASVRNSSAFCMDCRMDPYIMFKMSRMVISKARAKT